MSQFHFSRFRDHKSKHGFLDIIHHLCSWGTGIKEPLTTH